jgi:hypothetical protein
MLRTDHLTRIVPFKPKNRVSNRIRFTGSAASTVSTHLLWFGSILASPVVRAARVDFTSTLSGAVTFRCGEPGVTFVCEWQNGTQSRNSSVVNGNQEVTLTASEAATLVTVRVTVSNTVATAIRDADLLIIKSGNIIGKIILSWVKSAIAAPAGTFSTNVGFTGTDSGSSWTSTAVQTVTGTGAMQWTVSNTITKVTGTIATNDPNSPAYQRSFDGSNWTTVTYASAFDIPVSQPSSTVTIFLRPSTGIASILKADATLTVTVACESGAVSAQKTVTQSATSLVKSHIISGTLRVAGQIVDGIPVQLRVAGSTLLTANTSNGSYSFAVASSGPSASNYTAIQNATDITLRVVGSGSTIYSQYDSANLVGGASDPRTVTQNIDLNITSFAITGVSPSTVNNSGQFTITATGNLNYVSHVDFFLNGNLISTVTGFRVVGQTVIIDAFPTLSASPSAVAYEVRLRNAAWSILSNLWGFNYQWVTAPPQITINSSMPTTETVIASGSFNTASHRFTVTVSGSQTASITVSASGGVTTSPVLGTQSVSNGSYEYLVSLPTQLLNANATTSPITGGVSVSVSASHSNSTPSTVTDSASYTFTRSGQGMLNYSVIYRLNGTGIDVSGLVLSGGRSLTWSPLGGTPVDYRTHQYMDSVSSITVTHPLLPSELVYSSTPATGLAPTGPTTLIVDIDVVSQSIVPIVTGALASELNWSYSYSDVATINSAAGLVPYGSLYAGIANLGGLPGVVFRDPGSGTAFASTDGTVSNIPILPVAWQNITLAFSGKAGSGITSLSPNGTWTRIPSIQPNPNITVSKGVTATVSIDISETEQSDWTVQVLGKTVTPGTGKNWTVTDPGQSQLTPGLFQIEITPASWTNSGIAYKKWTGSIAVGHTFTTATPTFTLTKTTIGFVPYIPVYVRVHAPQSISIGPSVSGIAPGSLYAVTRPGSIVFSDSRVKTRTWEGGTGSIGTWFAWNGTFSPPPANIALLTHMPMGSTVTVTIGDATQLDGTLSDISQYCKGNGRSVSTADTGNDLIDFFIGYLNPRTINFLAFLPNASNAVLNANVNGTLTVSANGATLLSQSVDSGNPRTFTATWGINTGALGTNGTIVVSNSVSIPDAGFMTNMTATVTRVDKPNVLIEFWDTTATFPGVPFNAKVFSSTDSIVQDATGYAMAFALNRARIINVVYRSHILGIGAPAASFLHLEGVQYQLLNQGTDASIPNNVGHSVNYLINLEGLGSTTVNGLYKDAAGIGWTTRYNESPRYGNVSSPSIGQNRALPVFDNDGNPTRISTQSAATPTIFRWLDYFATIRVFTFKPIVVNHLGNFVYEFVDAGVSDSIILYPFGNANGGSGTWQNETQWYSPSIGIPIASGGSTAQVLPGTDGSGGMHDYFEPYALPKGAIASGKSIQRYGEPAPDYGNTVFPAPANVSTWTLNYRHLPGAAATAAQVEFRGRRVDLPALDFRDPENSEIHAYIFVEDVPNNPYIVGWTRSTPY